MKIKEHCGCDGKGHPEMKPVPVIKTIKKIVKQAREKEKLEEDVDRRAAKKLVRKYHQQLPISQRAGKKQFSSDDIRNCTTGNCATHTKQFIDYAKSKGVDAKAISMQGPKVDHIAARIDNKIVDPTHYQFTKKRPNSVGGNVSDVKRFGKNYGKHGYDISKTMTSDIATIEKTPNEKGGAGGKLTYGE